MYAVDQHTLLIRNFVYDGNGKDTFFWAGTSNRLVVGPFMGLRRSFSRGRQIFVVFFNGGKTPAKHPKQPKNL